MLNDTAFILRSVNYKESDKILTLYTRHHGKLSAIARGARKSAKRFGGALLPFAIFEVALTPSRKGMGNLLVIGEATLIRENAGLAKDLERLGAAAFLLELIREAAPEHESSGTLFDLIVDALAMLSDSPTLRGRHLLLSAGLRILAKCGLAISVAQCNACGTKVPSQKSVHFDALRGGVVCTACGGGPLLLDADAVTALIYLQQHPMAEGAQVAIDLSTLEKIESAFCAFVEAHLEKQLKTPAYMNQITRRTTDRE